MFSVSNKIFYVLEKAIEIIYALVKHSKLNLNQLTK